MTLSSPDQVVDGVLAGDARSGARLISLIEEDAVGARRLLLRLFPHTGAAWVIGVTGPPGVGKSTLVDRLIAGYRKQGRRVAVLAVDPSSPIGAGALLGDRVRMRAHAADPDVFIRSMANRRHPGGLAADSPAAIRVLDALGFERVIVETVGVGQSEVAVAGAADCTVVVVAPGAGDALQAAKAGLAEVADLFVVNKADQSGADRTKRDLELAVHLRSRPGRPDPPVLLTRADRGDGGAELIGVLDAHLAGEQASGRLAERRLAHLQAEVRDTVAREGSRRLAARLDLALSDELVDALRHRRLDPAAIAAEILAGAFLGAEPPDGDTPNCHPHTAAIDPRRRQ